MNTVPRLYRSFPFWLLLVGSLASIAYGAWLTVDKLTTMTSTLQDNTATGVEVYAGQAWIVFAAAFVGAGLIGLVAVLTLTVARSFVGAGTVEVVEAIDWNDAADDAVVAPAAAEPTVPAETTEAAESAALPEPATR